MMFGQWYYYVHIPTRCYPCWVDQSVETTATHLVMRYVDSRPLGGLKMCAFHFYQYRAAWGFRDGNQHA